MDVMFRNIRVTARILEQLICTVQRLDMHLWHYLLHQVPFILAYSCHISSSPHLICSPLERKPSATAGRIAGKGKICAPFSVSGGSMHTLHDELAGTLQPGDDISAAVGASQGR